VKSAGETGTMMGLDLKRKSRKKTVGGKRMLRLAKETDLVMIQSYPEEVQIAVQEVLKILDENYGADRNPKADYGGYVILTESEDDFGEIEAEMNVEVSVDSIPEYVDIIRCENRKVYTSSLFLLGSDYGIVLVMPYDITPKNLLNYAE